MLGPAWPGMMASSLTFWIVGSRRGCGTKVPSLTPCPVSKPEPHEYTSPEKVSAKCALTELNTRATLVRPCTLVTIGMQVCGGGWFTSQWLVTQLADASL